MHEKLKNLKRLLQERSNVEEQRLQCLCLVRPNQLTDQNKHAETSDPPNLVQIGSPNLVQIGSSG